MKQLTLIKIAGVVVSMAAFGGGMANAQDVQLIKWIQAQLLLNRTLKKSMTTLIKSNSLTETVFDTPVEAGYTATLDLGNDETMVQTEGGTDRS